jgi:diguanylate cyclase (GGDEF)-like protein
MNGQFYLSLLNPFLAFSFAGLTALLLRRWPKESHLLPLCVAFSYLGLAFLTQAWPLLSRPGSINYAGNALFFATVLLVCISALLRAGAGVPVKLFAVLSAGAAAGFGWFAFVEPSMAARIYSVNGGFALLMFLTALRLYRHGPRDLADGLFVAGMLMGTVLCAARPILILTGSLSIEGQDVSLTGYWASVLGVTPFLTIMVVSIFMFALVLDIFADLRSEADQDFLTGLLNRRGFETRSDGMLMAAGRQDAPALLVADIDDFKQINDRFGHAVGDTVIAAVGGVLHSHGGADLAGRTGGEEFALFFAQGSRRLLEQSAATLREALAGMHIAGLPAGYGLTISIGLHARDGDESLADMMRAADRALYEAKAAGKNRAVMTPMRLRSV